MTLLFTPCFIMAICNPLLLAIFVLLSSLWLLLPHGHLGVSALLVASAPMLLVLIAYNWITQVSLIAKKLTPAFKYAVLLLALLFLISDDNYFHMIAQSQRVLHLNSVQAMTAVLSLIAQVLLYSALAALLLILPTIMLEYALRMVAGRYFSELDALIEGTKFILIIIAISFASKSLLELVVKSF